MHSNPKAIISQKATPIEATAQALQSAATGANEHGRTLRLSALQALEAAVRGGAQLELQPFLKHVELRLEGVTIFYRRPGKRP